MVEICQYIEGYIVLDPVHLPFTSEEWQRILKDNNIFRVCQMRLRVSINSGLPYESRGKIWALLSRSNLLQYGQKKYSDYLNTIDTIIETNIKKDIGRTYPHHPLFKNANSSGQVSMFNILKAYANYDPEIGYCQGMNFIVGLLLMHQDEESVFWTFVSIMFQKDWRSLFQDGTPRLTKLLTQLSNKVKEKDAEIWSHLDQENVDFSIFAKYFLTFFMCGDKVELGARVLDRFLCYGEDELIDIILQWMLVEKNKILQMSFEEIIMCCGKEVTGKCFDSICGKFHINWNWEDEYTIL